MSDQPSSRFALSTMTFRADDWSYLLVIVGGLVCLVVPPLSLFYLLAVFAGWLVRWSNTDPTPADDRQDTHDR